jgi:Fungal Zn(2)-Cys(6) binuclear cluster domain
MTLEGSELANAQAPPHQISCIVCRQRKVKCDKQQRCSNCVKAGIECVYATPARPRRRFGNGKLPEDISRDELINRVRRYEALFRKHGLKLESVERDNAAVKNSNNGSPSSGNAVGEYVQVAGQSQAQPQEESKPRMASQQVPLPLL